MFFRVLFVVFSFCPDAVFCPVLLLFVPMALCLFRPVSFFLSGTRVWASPTGEPKRAIWVGHNATRRPPKRDKQSENGSGREKTARKIGRSGGGEVRFARNFGKKRLGKKCSSNVRRSFSARVPRSSFARVRRALASHIMEEEGEEQVNEKEDEREDGQQRVEGRVLFTFNVDESVPNLGERSTVRSVCLLTSTCGRLQELSQEKKNSDDSGVVIKIGDLTTSQRHVSSKSFGALPPST